MPIIQITSKSFKSLLVRLLKYAPPPPTHTDDGRHKGTEIDSDIPLTILSMLCCVRHIVHKVAITVANLGMTSIPTWAHLPERFLTHPLPLLPAMRGNGGNILC